MNIWRAILCLSAVCCCVSCTNLYQHCFDMGAEYSGVEVVQGNTAYRLKGKTYIRGQRAAFRRVGCDPEVLIGKPTGDQFRKIEGSEQEILYREVVRDGKYFCFADGSSWQNLSMEGGSPCSLSKGYTPSPTIDGERRLTARALYAYPLGVAAGVLVDAPLNALAVGVAGPLMVCSIPAMAVSAQQQLPPSRE